MKNLILKDNTVIEDGEAGIGYGALSLFFKGYTFKEAADMMCDPEKTGRIIFSYGDTEEVYTGYTNCTSIRKDEDGEISVILERG